MLTDNIQNDSPEELRFLVRERQIFALGLAVEVLEGSELRKAPHHKPICYALDRVIRGEIKRLIINVPPGYGKTLAAVWTFIARGFVVNPQARFIHSSYSQDLALDNSSKVKDILLSEEWQHFNPLSLKDDTSAKGLWRTDTGGGLRAVQSGGGITGFRAGQMQEGFSGAFVLDDPLKPDDARSQRKTAVYSQRYNTTIASRLAHEDVPIVVIMQRLCRFNSDEPELSGDMSEFLLRGGSGEMWHHLLLPIEIDNSVPYPSEWTHGIPIPHGLQDGVLWDYKHTRADVERLKRANRVVFDAQYQQRPTKHAGGGIIKGSWFNTYTALPTLRKIAIFADTANKTAERHDYSVFLCAGLGADGNLYLLDMLRGKWEITDLIAKAKAFWDKHKRKHGMDRLGASELYVEDKASGTQLIQTLVREMQQTIKPVQRATDKFTRVNGVVAEISGGKVLVPAQAIVDSKGNPVTDAAWVSDFMSECEAFTADDSHAFDDQVDTLVDAIERLLLVRTNLYGNAL